MECSCVLVDSYAFGTKEKIKAKEYSSKVDLWPLLGYKNRFRGFDNFQGSVRVVNGQSSNVEISRPSANTAVNFKPVSISGRLCKSTVVVTLI